MIKYSPKNTDNSKFSVGDRTLSRVVVNGSPYIVNDVMSSTTTLAPSFGGWYAFLSDKSPTEIETLFATGVTSFEVIRSHGTKTAWFTTNVGDLTDFYTYDASGSITLNIGKLLSPDARVTDSASGNGGVFVSPSSFTVKTFGINFVGGSVVSGVFNPHSDNYFLFTVGDKDSDAEVKIYHPALQTGDIVDLSDMKLTIQIPTTVG